MKSSSRRSTALRHADIRLASSICAGAKGGSRCAIQIFCINIVIINHEQGGYSANGTGRISPKQSSANLSSDLRLYAVIPTSSSAFQAAIIARAGRRNNSLNEEFPLTAKQERWNGGKLSLFSSGNFRYQAILYIEVTKSFCPLLRPSSANNSLT